MAEVWMVVAVRRNHLGDVVAAQVGKLDSSTNTWLPGREPKEMDVVDLVNKVVNADLVYSRMPNGAAGPKVRYALARVGNGVETIELDDPVRTVADLAQY
ncbi:hypothetical protein [Xenophilus sp.]|uniref:hypothetical protein n=1 Tax=Xenophilus sp. TaxID=1873499 RepID=UPI0037DC186A